MANLLPGATYTLFWPTQIKCYKVASCFQACLGFVRSPAVREDDIIVNTLPNCLTYRQIPGAGTGAAGSAPAKRVPVLFSTNRGLYLRLAQPALEVQEQNYNISFCDLERWSTNRANVVSLQDTFNMMSAPATELQTNQPRPQLWNNYAAYHHFKYGTE